MSKRQSCEKPRHLYLVLDDWSRGYSIRKIELSPEDIRPPLIPADVVRGDAIFAGRYTLPSALFRFEGRRGEPKSIVGAFGNKVLASLPLTHGESLVNLVRIFDVHTRIEIICPSPRLDFFNAIHIPIGGRIFALSSDSFNLLNLPLAYDANRDNVVLCLKLPKPTFRCDLITSYAVHPDKQTIFVSSVDESGAPATFTFETLESMVWRLHGTWQLPFSGRGYFVPKLGALVGLSGHRNTIGHICSCVVSTDSVKCPALKLSKEKLFSVVPGEKHIGATLVYLGYETKFCLLEGICIEADHLSDSDENNETEFDKMNMSYIDYLNETDSDEIIEESVDEVNQELDQKRFLRLTTFSLSYDRNGYLTIGDSRRVWYYRLSTEVTEALLRYPVAFWM